MISSVGRNYKGVPNFSFFVNNTSENLILRLAFRNFLEVARKFQDFTKLYNDLMEGQHI